MHERRQFFRWFWAWADDREEAWLTEMAGQGWHLVQPGALGRYLFERGEPGQVAYRLDFRTLGRDREQYLQLFADAGWEHIGAMGGWQYFRKPIGGAGMPEIYTDNASKMTKYARLLGFLVILLPVYFNLLISPGKSASSWVQVVQLFAAGLMILYVYAMVRILRRILQLRQQS